MNPPTAYALAPALQYSFQFHSWTVPPRIGSVGGSPGEAAETHTLLNTRNRRENNL